MSINITDKHNCSGCTACAYSCTKHAINMRPDALGFMYPDVNATKCTECGLCEKVCQFKADYDRYENYAQPLAYAVRHKSKDIFESSQTAGASMAIIDAFLEDGGIVYGASYDSEFQVIHTGVQSKEDARSFQGSKYVQSNLTGIFPQIRENLQKGSQVLFFGTPCQIAGLKSFIPKRLHTNLYTVDLICHGVPSPKLWQSYLKYLENKYRSKLTNVNFRDKRFGWHECFEMFQFKDGTEVSRRSFDHLFFLGICSRLSCEICPYTNLLRVGDLTIGDFWGWEKNHNQWCDDKGVNLCLINSDKGVKLFDKMKDSIASIPCDLTEILQPQLQKPMVANPKRLSFEDDFSRKGFGYVGKKYGDLGLKHKAIVRLQNIKHKIFR